MLGRDPEDQSSQETTFLKRSNLFKNQMYNYICIKEQIVQSNVNNKSL